MRHRRNEQLSLESASIRSSTGEGSDPTSAVQTGGPEIGDTTAVNTKSARRQRRSFLTLEDDHPQQSQGSSRHSTASSFMPSQTDLEEEDEDYYSSSLLRPRDALSLYDPSSSSPVSTTTLGAASISSPATPASLEDQTQVQDAKPASVQHPDNRDHTAAANSAAPLRLCASLASIPEADQRVTHSSTAPIARRSVSYYSTRSNSYSGDSAWNTPALTNATSIASSRPTSSAFLTDTDASNRVSVVESSYSSNSMESPTIEQSQPKPSLPHSDSHASSLEVLTVNTRPYKRQDSLPSPSNIGLGVTTEDEDEAPSALMHHASDSSLHVRQLSSGGRQRSQWSTESRSRSSSVAERVERARLSSVTGSFADHRGRSRTSSATTPTVRAFGLQHVSTETTSWCLRGIAAEQVVPALNSMMGLNKLTVLDISHCGLTELPLSIQSFTSLKYLDITNNKLSKRSLPAFLASITSLEKLVADCCDLHSLHHPLSTLSNLQTLSLQDNQLKSLPSWLSHLEQLRDLRLDGNPLFGVFADLSKPLLRSATSRKRVSSVTSLAQSMFQPQSSQSSSVQGSPMLSVNALPPTEASPLFGSVRSSRVPTQPSSPVRDRAQSSAPAFHTAVDQSLHHHPSLLHGGIRKMRSSNDVAKDAEQQQQSLQVDTKACRKSAYAELPSPVRPDLPRDDTAPAAPQSAPSQQLPMSPPPSQPQTPPPSAPPQSVRKKTSFFKKMGTFGRSRKDSNKPRRSEESQFTPSPPMVAPAEMPPPVPEKTDVSSSPQTVMSPPNSRPVSVAPMSRPQSSSSVASARTQLKLDQTPPANGRGAVIALNEDDSEAEEIFDQSFEQSRVAPSPEQQRATGLQALMAYLKDLDDLTPRDSLPLHLGQPRPAMSRRNTTSQSSLVAEQAETESAKSGQANNSIDAPVSLSDMKLKIDLVKRESVINEMVATERSYVAGLQELVDIYVLPSAQPVKSASSSSKESIIPLPERKAVFSNIENLLQFHKSAFLPDLEAVIAPLRGQRQSQTPESEANQALLTEVAEELARVFVRHGAFLKMYHIYVNNFDAALTRFQSWTAQSPPSGGHLMSTSKLVTSSAVAAAPGGMSATDLPSAPTASLSSSQKKRVKAFLQKSRLDPKHSQMNCESYLLMPIQRIPRYRMLLEQLVGCTPMEKESGLQTNPVLSAALGLASDLANDLNEKKRESEGRTRLLYWQARIGNKFKSPLVQPHRLLLKEARMIVSRTVKRSTDFASSPTSTPSNISQSMFQVESLKVEEQHRPLIALLSSDILVLVVDSGSAYGPVDLYAVIRLGRTANSQCATACGKNDSTLRVVDPQRAILYLEPGSALEAQTWAQAINQQAISF